MKARRLFFLNSLTALLAGTVVLVVLLPYFNRKEPTKKRILPSYQPRSSANLSGFDVIESNIPPWDANASLQEIAQCWDRPGYRLLERIDGDLQRNLLSADDRIRCLLTKAIVLSSEGEAHEAYHTLEEARTNVENNDSFARLYLFTIVYLQGVAALRIGENENCILCRGESSCILPIAPAAVHRNPYGSRLAIQHFSEYLRQFPDDLKIRWLLNLAHMTLGEYPHQVEPQFLVRLDSFLHSEFDIGKFRDVGHLLGVNRFNQAGGAIMDDFDNDGRLDLVVTSMDPTEPMGFYRNKGDGTFEECAAKAGLTAQLGGLNCMQCDYNNDGWLDIFVCRGAWLSRPIRPSLLHNKGDGTFTDVTDKAGLNEPLNSNAVAWADYDNDGFLDLFVCCERQPNHLFHNKGDGTFEEVAARANVADFGGDSNRLPSLLGGSVSLENELPRLRNFLKLAQEGSWSNRPDFGKFCKGVAWIDFDNDDYPDLFLNNLNGNAELFHNNRDGTFSDVTSYLGIDGPSHGFSCWAWDFDNDGWLDIFATSYDFTLQDVVKGLQGQPHLRKDRNKLYWNQNGKRFQDQSREAGLDQVFACMGSNFGDFDNDGYLDFYLGTGEPNFATLVPNRMFKNVAGRRFAEITAPSGTGHLQKGHGVACGDWDRDGNLDIFIEMGGAINGDKFHNVLFQNPGQGNHWLTVKLIGRKSNRAGVGTRIKAVTAGDKPLTVCRHISSGSSFGANPYQQTLGLAQAERVARLEIHWPTSGATQIFRDVAVDQAIEVTEFTTAYRRLNWPAIPSPR